MKKHRLSKAQFTEAVYRHYYGETLASIAEDFGITQSALSQYRDRHHKEWERRMDYIIAHDVARLSNQQNTDIKTREHITRLLCLLLNGSLNRKSLIESFCHETHCTPSEAETYIEKLETLLPLKIPS